MGKWVTAKGHAHRDLLHCTVMHPTKGQLKGIADHLLQARAMRKAAALTATDKVMSTIPSPSASARSPLLVSSTSIP